MTARVDPPVEADERTTLVAFLDFLRETMIWKLEGLSEAQARWTPADTANSLIAMVQHLAYVERWWFRQCFAGMDLPGPPGSDEDPDADLKVADDRTVGDVVAFYRDEYAAANVVIRRAPSLDDLSKIPSRKQHRSLRWILVHMIEETARHAGHADITRELIDGSLGE